MLYGAMALVFVVLASIILFVSGKLLLRRGWFMSWLKGMLGMSLMLASLTVLLMAWDVFSYQQLLKEKSVATVSFEQLGEQYYQAVLVNSDGSEAQFELRGDQWQLDARILKWQGFVAAWGIESGFRLDRLSGRYYALEEERTMDRTVYDLNPSVAEIDVWQWLREMNSPLVDAVYGSATFVPMSDNALYEVSLTNSGLIARPLNDAAKQSVSRWQ